MHGNPGIGPRCSPISTESKIIKDRMLLQPTCMKILHFAKLHLDSHEPPTQERPFRTPVSKAYPFGAKLKYSFCYALTCFGPVLHSSLSPKFQC